MGQVIAGTLDPITACMQVLKEAQLTASGANLGYLSGVDLASASDQSSTEAKEVLRNLNTFHQSWFPSNNISSAMIFLGESGQTAWRAIDTSEAALHLTRTVLQPGVPYSEIVTAATAMEGLRDGAFASPTPYSATYTFTSACGPGANVTATDPSHNPFTYTQLANVAQQTINVPAVQRGELLGVRPIAPTSVKGQATIPATSIFTDYSLLFFNAPINQAFGAGIVGTQSYLMLNMGLSNDYTSTGGLTVPRRWAEHVFSDLLCRNLPVIRTSDAALYVQTTNLTANTPPFRKMASCMQCHAGMDPMADTIRDLAWGTSNGNPQQQLPMVIKVGKGTTAAESGYDDNDLWFFNRPDNGSLNFRSYDGTLVNIPVVGLPALGNALASTNDLYVCAAKRYTQYLTGINANLQDIGDPSNPTLSAQDLANRNQVIQWGLQLKQTQNVQTLIETIMRSPLYQGSSQQSN